jgi:hypothetical protein
MATTPQSFILANLILAVIALVLLVTSLATNFWIESKLLALDGSFGESRINYGLFVGHVAGRRLTQVEMDLSSKPLSLLTQMNLRMCI